MIKFFCPILALFPLICISCGKTQLSPEEKIKSGEAIVTLEATDITMNSAVLHGYVKKEGLSTNAEVGIIFSKSQNPSSGKGTKLVADNIGANGRFSVKADGLTSSEMYYYRAFLSSGDYREGDVMEFTTEAFSITAIDMGLSVKWGNANLGADAPEDYGDYYAWGETTTKNNYSWSAYEWCDGTYDTLNKYNYSSSFGTVDGLSELTSSDDVAAIKMGGRWRMPTFTEVIELANTKDNPKYKWTYKSINDKDGWEVEYLVNGNSIFLPLGGHRCDTTFGLVGVGGHFWSSSLYTGGNSFGAYYLRVHKDIKYTELECLERCFGFSVRPVLP